MRFFVTGGTGFIGSHFLHAALAAGHEVVALRRPGSQPRISLPGEPTWVHGDLEGDYRESLAGCDALMHLAAIGVSPKQATWPEYFRWNVQASLGLWLQGVESGVRRLIVCGSCFEYGRAGERYEFIPPDAPLEPTGAYPASKAAASLAALALATEKRLSLAVLRPFHVFGDGEDPASLRGSLSRAAAAGADFPMTPGEQVRDFCPVEETAAAFLHAAIDGALPAGHPVVRNLGSGRLSTVGAFTREWWERLGATGRLLPGALPYRVGEVMRYVPRL